MLKKTLIVCLLFLTGCGPLLAPLPTSTASPQPSLIPTPTSELTPSPPPTRTPIPTHVFRDDDSAAIQVFKPSENCPNVCWRGIHAGTTSAGQAVTMLRISKEVGEFQIFDDYIRGTFGVIRFSNGIVTSINLPELSSVYITVDDFIGIMGEPDELMNGSPSCFTRLSGRCLKYKLYYFKLSALAIVHPDGGPGPSPHDVVVGLTVNIPLENEQQYFRPWLGYGHFAEYSLNPMATETPYP